MAAAMVSPPFSFNNRMGAGSPDNAQDESRKLFLGGLSWETEERDVHDYFKNFGEIEKVTVKFDSVTGRSRGFGFVTFASEDSVEAVLNAGPHFIRNRPIDPKRPKGKAALKKIFVGGINGDMSKEEVKAYFEQFGAIESIERPFDRQRNRSRDYCFVIFETEEGAENAIAQPKQVIGGKECDIKLAHRTQRNMMGGQPGGYGFAGGNGYMGGRNGMGNRGPQQGFKPRGPPNGHHNSLHIRNNDRMGGGGAWRGGAGGHDDRFADTQFLTNVDTMPNNGYKPYGVGNSNFFPNYWN